MDIEEFSKYVTSQFEQIGKVFEHQDFVIRALTSEVTEIKKALPREAVEEPGEPGETRGETTVYKLPEGYGMLRVTINPATGEATIDYGQQKSRQKVKLQLGRHP